MALLKDTIATLQVDVLTLKQQFHVVDRLRADQMKSVTVTLDGIECDLLACSKFIQGCVDITSTQIAASRANLLTTCGDSVNSIESRVAELEGYLENK